jgi:hypothetical protein
MTSKSEYDDAVQRWKSASVALFGVVAVSIVLVVTGHAQVNAPPTSVTSPGFGGRAINGAPASVTSLGPNGFAPTPRVTFSGGPVLPSTHTGNGHRDHHRDHGDGYVGPVWYAVPYAVDLTPQENTSDADADANDDDDPEYQGGPTIFDRRGSGEASYVPPVKDVPHPHASAARQQADAAEQTPQVQTVLVFKDGHDVEVGNYAIVGNTLFDLTPGHPRRIAVADLDLDSTVKKNDDRGVMFELPSMQQAN